MAQSGLFGGSGKVSFPLLEAPVHGTGYAIADSLLGGWLSYGEKQRLGQQQRQAAASSARDLIGMFDPPPPTAADPSLPLNAGTNVAVQPEASIPSVSDPSVVQKLIRAKLLGVDVAPLVEILKANKAPDPQWAVGPDGRPYNQHAKTAPTDRFSNPTNVNGWVTDMNDPSMVGRYFGAAPQAGMNPEIGGDGKLDWSMPAKALTSLGRIKQAESAGAASGSAPYEFINVPTPTGAPRTVAKSVAAGGSFTGQNPVEAKQEGAAADARAVLPKVLDQAQATLDLIDKMRAHPALPQRTGGFSMVPSIPGTPGAAFDAMADQIGGTAFLQAFEQLKGGGQITEIEGKKATDAIARLNKKQGSEDYISALGDLRSVVSAGMARARGAARPAAGGGGAGMGPAGVSRSAIDAELRRRGLRK